MYLHLLEVHENIKKTRHTYTYKEADSYTLVKKIKNKNSHVNLLTQQHCLYLEQD